MSQGEPELEYRPKCGIFKNKLYPCRYSIVRSSGDGTLVANAFMHSDISPFHPSTSWRTGLCRVERMREIDSQVSKSSASANPTCQK